MVAFPRRLELARLPTPLTRLARFKAPGGARIWIKHDELTGTEATGNKARKLEFILAEALERGCSAVITCGGVQSNHCRAAAVLGARLGLRVRLILRGEEPAVPDGNLLLDRLAGAGIDWLPAERWSGHPELAERIRRELAARGEQAHFIPVGGTDEVGLWGYIAAAGELARDFERLDLAPDYIVTATGSGGTQGGLAVGARLFGLPGAVAAFNVCDDAAFFERRIRRDVRRWKRRYGVDFDEDGLAVATIEGYAGPAYGEADPEVYALIARLAREEGLFLDPVYTGKAFYGMLGELEKGDRGRMPGARDVVFVHTGGLFGALPHRRRFRFEDP